LKRRSRGSTVTPRRHSAGKSRRKNGRIRLAGARQPEPPFAPLLELDKPTPAVRRRVRAVTPPPLDGSHDGFDTSEPLRLELEDQYRRSEEPYPGPDDFSAVAHLAWDDDALYLAVEVVKPELCIRPASAPPLRLDNEPDDIHSTVCRCISRPTKQRGRRMTASAT